MPLRQSPNRRVAGHLPNRVEVLGQHSDLRAQPGGSEGSFHTGVTGSDDEDVVALGIAEHEWEEATGGVAGRQGWVACSTWNGE